MSLSRRLRYPDGIRRFVRVCAALVALGAVQSACQTAIPSGTILPVSLRSSLNSHKTKAGETITGRITQDVPLPAGLKIRRGARVVGRVIAVAPATSTGGARITLKFDTLQSSKHSLPVVTNLRAIASMMAVHDAQLPLNGPDRGTSESAWTTDQIGGEVVYRGGGPVTNGEQVVGRPAPYGVLVRVSSKAAAKCRGDADGNRLQALWVFSSDACGAYDFPNLAIVHAGRSKPVGAITLASHEGDLRVPAGSGMLLRTEFSNH